ncbi:hypothetical protein [Diaphorobacter caeni]|uniref:hypothetical protein n=1 Tax=Diaphorobacter caeni TaxID=2784387 RepID=UPI00188E8C6D|nr:hypothetical protein [Diaphorobacter caeni]MBF5004763.1 hypothetical protein [Diaphorobacter caeni]
MQYKQSFKNPDHREVFGKVQQFKDLRQTCQVMFRWLVERYASSTDFQAMLEDDGDSICIKTPAGSVRSRILMMEMESIAIARIVFVSRLDPADSLREVPIFALTVRDYYGVTAGDDPGRAWEAARSHQEPWAARESLALGYDLLAGQLEAASLLMAAPV